MAKLIFIYDDESAMVWENLTHDDVDILFAQFGSDPAEPYDHIEFTLED